MNGAAAAIAAATLRITAEKSNQEIGTIYVIDADEGHNEDKQPLDDYFMSQLPGGSTIVHYEVLCG